jgi:hypothetical protein
MINGFSEQKGLAYWFAALLLAMMLALVWLDYWQSSPSERQLRGSDIYYIWIDGKEIESGSNPYSRIHGSDMLHNKKYSTYLPGFFLLEVVLIKLGIDNFEKFFPLWQFLVTLLFSLIAVIIFESIFKLADSIAVALFAAMFWTLGRWSFGALRIWQIDFLAILFLLLAYLKVSNKNSQALGFLFLGLSLSIKQIGVFALPLFMIELIRNRPESLKQIIINSTCLLLFPLLVSAPFLIWDATGYLQSLFFSVTRNPGGLKLETIDQALGVVGITAKIPLLLSLFIVYFLFFRARISLAQGILLSFVSFVSFNSVLFKQYFPWCSAFIGFALIDCLRRETKNSQT